MDVDPAGYRTPPGTCVIHIVKLCEVHSGHLAVRHRSGAKRDGNWRQPPPESVAATRVRARRRNGWPTGRQSSFKSRRIRAVYGGSHKRPRQPATRRRHRLHTNRTRGAGAPGRRRARPADRRRVALVTWPMIDRGPPAHGPAVSDLPQRGEGKILMSACGPLAVPNPLATLRWRPPARRLVERKRRHHPTSSRVAPTKNLNHQRDVGAVKGGPPEGAWVLWPPALQPGWPFEGIATRVMAITAMMDGPSPRQPGRTSCRSCRPHAVWCPLGRGPPPRQVGLCRAPRRGPAPAPTAPDRVGPLARGCPGGV